MNAQEFMGGESGLAADGYVTTASCKRTCDDHESFYKRLGDIAVRNVAFEQEFLSHLSALQEIARREQQARDNRAHVILDKLAKIDEKVGHVTNGGLKEAMMELVPVMINNIGTNKTETTRGRYAVIVSAISGLAAVGGALLSWLITR